MNRKIVLLITRLSNVEQNNKASPNHETILNDIDSLRFSWENMISGLRAYLVYRDEASLKEVKNYQSMLLSLLKKLKVHEKNLSSGGNAQLSKIEKLVNRVFADVDHVIEVHGGNNWRMDAQLIRTEIGPILVSMKEKLGQLISIQQKKINSSSNDLFSQLKQSRILLLLSLIVGIVFVIFISKLTLSKVMEFVEKLKTALSAFANGDLTYRMQVKGKGKLMVIAGEFNKFADDLQSIIQEITSVSSELIETSNQMATAAEQASASTEQQRNDSQESARSIQEMSMTVQDVAKSTSEAANAADLAEEEAVKGKQIVDQTNKAISTLADEVTHATSTINNLKEDTESIGMVLDVIKNIADQTNLLALNAAIEAARAGDQGRGFAVVADEVRTLASRTQESTQEIHTIIAKLQVGSENAVQVMERGSKQAEASVKSSAEAGNALQSINVAISKIKQMNDQIAAAAEEQSVVGENINKNVTNISQRTEQSVDRIQQTTIISYELSKLASQLKSKVEHFKI